MVHWERVCDRWNWPLEIETGDPERGAKLVCFVLELMSHQKASDGEFYPSSTISNYVWALCAFMQQGLRADPRVEVVGWRFFMASVTVMCFVPYEPRKRVPTAAIRSALSAVDCASFKCVQVAVFVLFLYFTFQRSEFPCPKTVGSLDHAKHCFVRHMEPHHGGTRWAVGSTKADPRAERLSGDAGPGREWIVVGEVQDELFDMRVWLARLYSFYPPGPRDPDSPFFRSTKAGPSVSAEPYLYRNALADFRDFLTGHVEDPSQYGIHGIRSEGFVVCSNAVGEEAAVMQGGWRGLVSASRYDRLTAAVQLSMAADMVAFTSAAGASPAASSGSSGSTGGVGIVARRAAAKTTRVTEGRDPSSSRQPRAALPPGWRRIWHATPRGRGYATYVGPCGRHARTIAQAVELAGCAVVAPPPRPVVPPSAAARVRWAPVVVRATASSIPLTVSDLVDHVTEFDRPPARRAPVARAVP